jgi:NADH dehydrogenase
MPGSVFVTGGSGFVGSAVVDELLRRGWIIHALVNHRPIEKAHVKNFHGGLSDAPVLDDGMAGCEAVIHLVGIIMENPAKGQTFERIHHQGTRQIVDATKRAGIKRYVHMSALGTREDAVSEYHKTKYLAEQYVRASGLDWTIFRPSLIHGPRGAFIQQEAKWARGQAAPFLFMPYFGAGFLGTGGAGKLQPVYVQDVARAFVDALEKPGTAGEVYPIGGSQVLTWPELHRAVANAVVGHSRWVMPIPVWKAKLLTKMAPASWLPFSKSQVIMSQEDNTCDNAKLIADFDFTPAAFESMLASYASTV